MHAAHEDISIGARLSRNRDVVRLEVLSRGEPIAHIDCDAAGLSALIEMLALERSRMAEQVPDGLEPKPRLSTVKQLNWAILAPDSDAQTLAIRHPGYGWLAFELAPSRAGQIAAALLGGGDI